MKHRRATANKLAWEIREFLGADFIRQTLLSADHHKAAQGLSTSARYLAGF
jgi:hypothetical protein